MAKAKSLVKKKRGRKGKGRKAISPEIKAKAMGRGWKAGTKNKTEERNC